MAENVTEFDWSIHSSDIMNVSFTTDNGEVLDLSMSVIDTETRIFEIVDPFALNLGEQEPQEPREPERGEQEQREPEPDSTLIGVQLETSIADTTIDGIMQKSFVQELIQRAEIRNEHYEIQFKEKMLMKIKMDFKNRFFKHSAAKFLHDTFGEMINDVRFVRWLAKGIDMRPYKLQTNLENYKREHVARNSLPEKVRDDIYKFWLFEENSIPSTDRRSGKDKVQISKMKYLQEYKHLKDIHDENITESSQVSKKTGNVKTYFSAQRMIYTKPMAQLHQKFLKSTESSCSLSTFKRYKPFYIGSPTEREKESCLCIRCQNAHLL